MATIKDVAALAGVSITTVSMVLNRTDDKISAKTKEKVFLAAEELGYNANKIARALASKKSNVIMAVIPDISNPFFSVLVKFLTNYCLEYNYFLYIHNSNNKSISKKDFKALLENNYIAACLLVDRNVKGLDDEIIEKYNVIFLDEVDFSNSKKNLVTGNNELGGILAMNYLLDRGFRKIGMLIGPRSTANSSRRLSGAIKASMNRDIYIDPKNIIHGDYSYEGGYAAGKFFLDRQVDAIFSFSDMSSYGLLNYFRENKIKVPRDISLVSYDNLFLNKIVSPRLTSIDQNLERIAKEAIDLADDLINKRKIETRIEVEPILFEGESVGRIYENN